MHGRKRAALAVFGIAVAALGVAAGAGIASAVSGGGYSGAQQDCPLDASAWNAPSQPDATDPGCHNTAFNVESGGTKDGNPDPNNTRFVEWGIDQSPNMNNNPSFGAVYNIGDPGTPTSPHAGCLAANTDGTGGGTGTGCGDNPQGAGFSVNYDYYALYCPATAMLPAALFGASTTVPAPYQCSTGQPIEGDNMPKIDSGSNTALQTILTQGLLVYFGMDDNSDNGEHDGVSGMNGTDGVFNSSSDGGGVTLSLTPQGALQAFSARHPEGLANLSEGECADGICSGLTTQEQTVYYGCGTNAATACNPGTAQNEPVFENGAPASTQEPADCSSGDATSETCADGSSLNSYRAGTPQQMNTEPGVQTYQDPDPQRSPALPWGTPGVYAGTCGLYVNDSGGAGSPGITGQDPGWIVDQPLGSCTS